MTNLGKYKIPEWYGIWMFNKLTKPLGGKGVVGSIVGGGGGV